MEKVLNLSGIQQEMTFTEFVFYQRYEDNFKSSALGRINFSLARLFLPSLTCKKGAIMTPFCINFPMNMAYYVAKHIVMSGMRQCILCPLSSYCLSPRVVWSLALGLDNSAHLVVEG